MEVAMAEAPAPSEKPYAADNSTPAETPSFLSALKASVEASKLYLALLGLLAGVPGAIWLVAAHWGVPFWFASIACVVPALLLLLWLVPTWIDRQNRRRAIAFGINGQVKDPEYFRLTPYDSASDFRRADNFHEKVYVWLVGNPAPLLYLSGASGSGKSSILSGWVLPTLAREGGTVHVVNIRVVGNPMSVLTQALLNPGAIWERPPTEGKLSLRDLLEKSAKRVAPKKLLLVLDQFEEFLILADGEQRDAFIALLRSLTQSTVPNLQLLMILRSDYQPLLDDLGLPAFEQDRKAVPPFYERDAMAFLRASELQIPDTLESEILEEARDIEQTPGLIRPITVNLFGLVLRHFEVLPKSYKKGKRLRSHLRGLIERKEIRDFAAPILSRMVTDNGTKMPVACTDIASTLGLDPRQVRGCLVQLANEGVVRELDRDRGKWEISHDFIAGLYHQILAGWPTSLWRHAKPWAIGGGIGLWLVLVVPMSMSIIQVQQENREQQALLDQGFNKIHCPGSAIEPGCLAWAAQPNLVDATLADAVPHLKRLKKTYSLDLSHTKIRSIELLKALTDLKTLDLSNSDVENIDALKGLIGLESLNLWDTRVSSFDALKGLTGLRQLDLRDTQFRDLDVLKTLAHLETLKLGGVSNVQNIDPLSELTTLKTLDLNGTQVENIDALKKMHDLQELYLANTAVRDVDLLKEMPSLKALVINDTNIENIDVTRKSLLLRTLVLARTHVTNIDALKGLSGLQLLDLTGTKVENIDALKGLSGLQMLDLIGTKVMNIDALKGLSGLQVLDLTGTKVENIDALKVALPKTLLRYGE
jgi:internalin A